MERFFQGKPDADPVRDRLINMTLPIVCIVDLGSNAIRFLMASRDQYGQLNILHRDRISIRIGNSVFATGRVGDEMPRIVEAIQKFQTVATQILHKTPNAVPDWKAVATSAMREADDRVHVIRSIQEATHLEIQILSGEQEAELALRSVAAVRSLTGPFVVADLGGGSLELILGHDGQILRCSSFRLGALRWQQALDSNNNESLNLIQCEIDRLHDFADNHRAQTVIGLGGGFRAMHRMTGQTCLERAKLKLLRDQLNPLSPMERTRKHGVPEDRADIIVPAIDALCLTLDAVQGTAWTVIEEVGGIADGLAQELLNAKLDQMDENEAG